MLCAYNYSLNACVVGACLAIVSAALWYMAEPVTSGGEAEAWGMWDQTQRFLVMLAPLGASVGFLAVAAAKSMAGGLTIAFMSALIGLCAMSAGIIFFGWGFDGCRAKAMQVYNFMAIVTALFVLMAEWNIMSNLVVMTVSLCNLVGVGGLVLYFSHMLFNSDHSEFATASAAWTLLGTASLVITFFGTFFIGSILPVVLLCILVLLSVAVNM